MTWTDQVKMRIRLRFIVHRNHETALFYLNWVEMHGKVVFGEPGLVEQVAETIERTDA